MPRLPKQLQSMKFLSTPSARRATAPQATAAHHGKISIHALREEGDGLLRTTVCKLRNFYPRPPRGGRLVRNSPACPFYSNFYPRPPRGGRPLDFWHYADNYNISIHALREEGDSVSTLNTTVEGLFLSTPSARRATHHAGATGIRPLYISIHALREEGD